MVGGMLCKSDKPSIIIIIIYSHRIRAVLQYKVLMVRVSKCSTTLCDVKIDVADDDDDDDGRAAELTG